MARPSILSTSQCAKACKEREAGTPVPKLAKKYKVSESTMYKVMDGTYVASPDPEKPNQMAAPKVDMAPVPGATPSIFSHPRRRVTDTATGLPTSRAQLRRTAELAVGAEIDELTLAAAELIVAKAHYTRALALNH